MWPIKKLNNKIRQQLFLARNNVQKRFGSIDIGLLKGSRVLVYHGIDDNDNRKYNTRFLSQKRLEEHLVAFRKYFNLVSLESILSNDVDPEAFNVALTFDDGYKNNASHALPVLERFNVPATFCITGISDTPSPILWADYLDIVAYEFKNKLVVNDVEYFVKKDYPWSHSEYVDKRGIKLKYLTKHSSLSYILELINELQRQVGLDQLRPYSIYWEQLLSSEIDMLSDHPLINIVSHGYMHASLANLSHESACEDIVRSLNYLERVTQKKINMIAYPDGSYNANLVNYGKSVGLEHHLIMTPAGSDLDSDPAIVPRITINPYISTHNQILAIIKGSYYGEV